MSSQLETQDPSDPRSRTAPARRVLHLLVVGAGWVLFARWWIEVLGRTRGSEITFTLAFLALSLVVIVSATSLWIAHNVAIFRNKGPRTSVRERVLAPVRDTLGRGVVVDGGRETLQGAAIVRIAIEGERKVYRAVEAGEGREARAAEEAA